MKATIASELPTKALFKPAFDNWLAIILVRKVAPPTVKPDFVAVFNAELKSSPCHVEVAKVIRAVIPKDEAEIIAPFTASYVKDSIVPAFAIFFACS